MWDEGRGVSRGQAGGCIRCFAHPLGGGVCRGHTQYLVFVPGSSKVATGFFWSLCISWVQNFPATHAHRYF